MLKKKTKLKTNREQELAVMFKSLGHPARVTILKTLSKKREHKMRVKAIYESLKMPQPIVSRHLGIMKKSGLLNRIGTGSTIFFEINHSHPSVKKIVNSVFV